MFDASLDQAFIIFYRQLIKSLKDISRCVSNCSISCRRYYPTTEEMRDAVDNLLYQDAIEENNSLSNPKMQEISESFGSINDDNQPVDKFSSNEILTEENLDFPVNNFSRIKIDM